MPIGRVRDTQIVLQEITNELMNQIEKILENRVKHIPINEIPNRCEKIQHLYQNIDEYYVDGQLVLEVKETCPFKGWELTEYK